MTDDLANVIRKLDDLEETRKALKAADGETCAEAAKRVMVQLERVRSERDHANADRERIRTTLGAGLMEPTLDAAKRMADTLKDYAGLKSFWHSMAVVLGCLIAKEAQVVPYDTTANMYFGTGMLDTAARLVKERDEARAELEERDGSPGRIATLENTLEQIGEILDMNGEGVVDAVKRVASLAARVQAENQKLDETVGRLKIDLQKTKERADRYGKLCEEIYNAIYWLGPCDLEAKTFEDRLRSKVAFVVKFASDSTLSLTAAFAANCATVDADSAYTWASMRTWCSEEKLKLVRLLVAKDGPV